MNHPESFKAFFVQQKEGKTTAGVNTVLFDFLPAHGILIRVHYSSLNYKDALSATAQNKVTRSYPHIPGIDAAGVVEHDASGTFNEGEEVIVTGHDLGTNTSGGFGEYIRVPSEWVLPKPSTISLEQSMIFGTAGFTAMYGIERLKRELITPDSGPVLVTGATGGVGSLAVFALSQMGYEVHAATRKTGASDFLLSLGADQVIDTSDVSDVADSPLLSRKWAAAIETVGGSLLDAVLRQIQDKGAVACCGNILGKELQTNVYPFILRGISLLGIDSAFCVRELREQIWDNIASIDFSKLPENYYRIISLAELPFEIQKILEGDQTGRVLVDPSKGYKRKKRRT